MRFKSVKYNLNRLISDGHKWQNIDINGKEVKPYLYFSSVQMCFIFISIGAVLVMRNGFNKDFVGYIIASLSIFIGLFLTLILTIFDKFQKIEFGKSGISEKERTFLKQRKNFFKQFTALTSYSILIAIFCIFLLSLNIAIDVLNHNIFEYSWVSSFRNINQSSIFNFLLISVTVLYRIVIVYLFLDFLLIVVYALSSMYNFISLEYDRSKIT